MLCSLPGILRLRPQVLPTDAREDACLFLVMLSLMRPSPVTLTVNGLPAKAANINVNDSCLKASSHYESLSKFVPGMCFSANLMFTL